MYNFSLSNLVKCGEKFAWLKSQRIPLLFASVLLYCCCQLVFSVHLSHVFLEVKVATESLATQLASIWLIFIVCMHVKCKVIHLMECLGTDVTLERLFSCMRQPMIFVVSFLVETLPAYLTSKWTIPGMYAHMGVQC